MIIIHPHTCCISTVLWLTKRSFFWPQHNLLFRQKGATEESLARSPFYSSDFSFWLTSNIETIWCKHFSFSSLVLFFDFTIFLNANIFHFILQRKHKKRILASMHQSIWWIVNKNHFNFSKQITISWTKLGFISVLVEKMPVILFHMVKSHNWLLIWEIKHRLKILAQVDFQKSSFPADRPTNRQINKLANKHHSQQMNK